MNPADFRALEDVVHRALSLPTAERPQFLEQLRNCSPTLFKQVKELLDISSSRLKALDHPLNPSPILVPGECIGAYTIQSKLGQGGMGVVYLAKQSIMGDTRPVALKVANHVHRGPTIDQEVRILARLTHPNIAKLYDGGVTRAGLPYYVMEFVQGKTLMTYCKKHMNCRKKRLRLFLKICDTVQAAHKQYIVHRDLKPANIMVDSEGEPRLLDFGIARMIVPECEAGVPIGAMQPLTPAYAAPEQLLNKPVTSACDIYALGLILYEMLSDIPARQLPNVEKKSDLLPYLLCQPKPLAKASSHAASSQQQVEEALERIVFKALRLDPGDRYRSVKALSSDLRRYLAQRPMNLGRRRGVSRPHNLKALVPSKRVIQLVLTLLCSFLIWQQWQSVRAKNLTSKKQPQAETIETPSQPIPPNVPNCYD